MNWKLLILVKLLFCAKLLAAQNINNDSILSLELDEIQVLGFKQKQSEELKEAIKRHQNIAGGTSIAIMRPETERLETLKDALKLEPGVMIQEFFGANDQPRLNIRGSGIQSNPQRRGVYLMQDGIPVNFADGSYIIGVMNPAISEFIEVYKGANALQYGAATLGGLIDFKSRKGTNSGNLMLKSQIGSFNYYSTLIMGGKKWDKLDAYFSLNGSKQRGFRQHNSNKNLNIATNLGYDVNSNIKNRWYLNYSYVDFDIPGPLTYKMLEEDPTQITHGVRLPIYMAANIARDKPKREVELFRLANKTDIAFNNHSKLNVSFYYQYANDRFVYPIVLSTQHSYNHDLGLKALWNLKANKHNIQLGLLSSYGKINRDGHINKNGLDSYLFSKDKLTAFNTVFFGEDRLELNNRTYVIAGLQCAYHIRNSKDVFPNPELRPWYSHSSHKYRYFYSENISLNQDYLAINPRIGAIYNAGKNKDIQFFTNASFSYEPPTFDELVGTEVTNNINTSPKKLFAVRLDKQKAFTAEIGTRHAGERFTWNISIYKSWLKDEILEVKDFVLGVKTTKNYPHSVHNGLEVGLTSILFKRIFSKKYYDQLILKTVYNYSDFYFSSGEYKNNQLAGLPKHYLAGSLSYKWQNLFLIEMNADYQPDDTPIDHENTLVQPSFYLLGTKIAYLGLKNFKFFIEAKNILDKRYASSYIINDQIHSPPIPFPNFSSKNMAFFMPGSTRSFYIGISFNLN